MAIKDRYKRFVYRVWDRLEQRTGFAPVYANEKQIISYCPACLIGTMLVTFVEYPKPGYVISSNVTRFSSECSREVVDFTQHWEAILDPGGRCSNGCNEDAIREALFTS